jgi:hypothetical protein
MSAVTTALRPRAASLSVSDVATRLAETVGVVAAFLLVALSARSGGGYFPVEYLTIGVAALASAAAVVVLRRRIARPSRRATVALCGLVLYAGWVGLSRTWSPAPDVASAEFERHVSYAAVLVLGLVTVSGAPTARAMAWAVGIALAGIAIAGLASRLLPGLGLPFSRPALDDYRLSWPLTYWNAQGAAGAMAAVLAVGFASDRRVHVAARLACAFVVPALAGSILLTVSRGSILAAAVGVVVLVALARRPLQTAVVAVGCAVPSAIAVALLLAEPSVVDDPAARPALSSVGPRLFAEVAALGVLAAGLAAGGLWVLRRVERDRRLRRGLRQERASWVPLAALSATAFLMVVLVVGASRLDGPVAARTTSVQSFVRDQRTAFLSSTPVTDAGVARLGSANGNRNDLYRVAWREFRGAPLIGAGVGAFPRDWLRRRRTPQAVQNVHSLPIEALAATGIIGLAALVAFFGAVVAGALRLRRRPGMLSRSSAAGVSAAVATFVASCAVDWTWQMGTLTAAALLLSATLLVDGVDDPRAPSTGSRRRRRRNGRRRSGRHLGPRGRESAANLPTAGP